MEFVAFLLVLLSFGALLTMALFFVIGLVDGLKDNGSSWRVTYNAKVLPVILWHPWFFGWRLINLILAKVEIADYRTHRTNKREEAINKFNERVSR